MAIKLNGVEITSNKLNGSDVTLETLNGVKVWPVTELGNKWVYLWRETSEPNYDYMVYANINTTPEDWIEAMEMEFPANDLPLGTMGYVKALGDPDYYILQVQEVKYKWVYLWHNTSEPDYDYMAYTDYYTTPEGWEYVMENEFPPNNLLLGTMGYVIAEGVPGYQILQVQED